MPKVRLELISDRRPVNDPVSIFILEGKRVGMIRDDRNLKPTSKRFTVEAAPDEYIVQIEIEGFRLGRKKIVINNDAPPVIPIRLTHRCLDLPEHDELHPAQRDLLSTLTPGSDPESIWRGLNDNQCATFFHLTHALLKKELANGRTLGSYVERIRRIGGVEIEDDLPGEDGMVKTAVGWRMHVVIREPDRARIASDLVEEDVFGEREGSGAHPVHQKFGLTRSHREKGALPRIQLVFDDLYKHADVDLDVEFHRSSPHAVFRHFVRKFPEVSGIYRY